MHYLIVPEYSQAAPRRSPLHASMSVYSVMGFESTLSEREEIAIFLKGLIHLARLRARPDHSDGGRWGEVVIRYGLCQVDYFTHA